MPLHARPDFLRSIRPHCGDGLVKVLTGLRRSGKSSLLRLIAADTAQKLDLPKEDFLFLDFEDSSLRRLTRPEILHDYIAEKAKGRESDSPYFSTKCGRSSPGKRSSAPCRTEETAISSSRPPEPIPSWASRRRFCPTASCASRSRPIPSGNFGRFERVFVLTPRKMRSSKTFSFGAACRPRRTALFCRTPNRI